MIVSVLIVLAVSFIVQSLFYLIFDKSDEEETLSGDHQRLASTVSVVIAARNEAKNLPGLLERLQKQDYPHFEVIVVNDKSGDDTIALWNRLNLPANFKLINIEQTPERWNSKKYALQRGIEEAEGEFILLTDGDCFPETSRWIGSMMQKVTEADVVLGIGPVTKSKGILGSFQQYENFMTHFQMLSLAKLGIPYMGLGRNIMYRKKVFDDEKGFAKIRKITGGDDDLLVNDWADKYKIKTCMVPEGRVQTLPKESWKEFFNQKVRHLSVGRMYKLKHKLLLGTFVGSKTLFWLCAMALLVSGWQPYLMIMLIVSFLLIVTPVSWGMKKIFNSKFNIQFLLFLDFLYVLYYITTSIRVVLTKEVKWT